MKTVPIVYFSDILCVWAYLAQLRVDAVKSTFPDQVRFTYKFCSVFPDTARRIEAKWKDAGGYEGFNAHVPHGRFFTLFGITWQQGFLCIPRRIAIKCCPLSGAQAFFGQLQQLEPALVPCLQCCQRSF